MEKKDMYELRELYDKLAIPLAELGRRAGVSELTVAKIRDGHSARRSSVNALLAAFAKIYELDNLSIDTVRGIIINDKLARQGTASQQKTVPSVSPSMPYETMAIPSPQNRHTIAKKGIEGSQKRNYTTAEDIPADWILCSDFFDTYRIAETTYRRWLKNGLEGETFEFEERDRPGRADKFRYFTPDQQKKAREILKRHDKLEYILASKFAEFHNVDPSEFEDYMLNGLGPGLIGTSTDTIPERDRVDYSELDKPGRKGKQEKYLNYDQQLGAIRFLHKFKCGAKPCDDDSCQCQDFECEDASCWCHKKENE